MEDFGLQRSKYNPVARRALSRTMPSLTDIGRHFSIRQRCGATCLFRDGRLLSSEDLMAPDGSSDVPGDLLCGGDVEQDV